MDGKRLKNIARKIPGISLIKIFYDWQREKILQSRINKFLRNKAPFTDFAPPFYEAGYEPTIRCNLKCKMCYQGETRSLRKEELTTSEAMAAFGRLKDKIKTIKLVGGEPFARSDILDLISFWDDSGARIILQTNCTLINESNIGVLKKFNHITDILTSLDGPKEIHDAVRGVAGTFEKLQNAVRLIRKNMPNAPITLSAVLLLNDNLEKIPDLINTAKDLGFKSLNVVFEQVYLEEDVKNTHRIFENIFGWEKDSYRINTQIRNPIFPDNIDSGKLKEKLSKIRSYGLKKGCFVNFVPFNYYLNLDKYLGEKPARVFCLKLLSPELRINQKGEVIWCDIIEKSFGSLLQKTPDEIWLSKEYQNFRNYLIKNDFPICRRCCKASYLDY